MARTSLRDFGLRSLLVLSTVLLSYLALPGGALPLAGPISLVPLGLALHGASPRAGAAYAYGGAFLGWLISTTGLATAFSSYAQAGTVTRYAAMCALCAWLALPYGIFGWLYGHFQWIDRRAGTLSAAACLTLVVTWFPTPLPIDSTHALYRVPVLIQILDFGGQPLLRFAFYLFNWAFIDALLRLFRRRNPGPALAVLFTLTLLVIAYGVFRLRPTQLSPSSPTLRIAALQPNIPLDGDSNRHSADALNPFHTLIDMSATLLAAGTPVDLVVWPETPLRITCDDSSGIRPQFTSLLERFHVPLLINCVQPAPGGGDYNTQLFLAPGAPPVAYRKIRLFPFAEYLPGETRFPFLRRLFPAVSRYVPSDRYTVFHYAGFPGVFMAICYEILFPAHPRPFIERGGRILITPSNDAWFGDSRIPDFQIAQSVFQAVQHRIPVVRVSNSGNTLHVQASGVIAPGSPTPAFTKTAAVYPVVTGVRPPYFRLGGLFLYLLALAFLLGEARYLAVRAGPR